MNTGILAKRSPWGFFLLVFALSIPFWVAGAVTGIQLLPGLPLSALGAFAPAIAAMILAYRERGAAGVTGLLKRSFDYKRIKAKAWYAPAVLLMPGVMALEWGLLRLMGTPVPAPQFAVLAPLALFVAFLVGALGEELGWSGYVTDPMQERLTALQAGILLGLITAAWHVPGLAQVGRSAAWIAWWGLGTVAGRVLLVWLYNNTGKSVFAAAVFHAMINVSWQLFPVDGSYYDPRITSLIMAGAAVIAAFVWGPRTLARYRYGCRAAGRAAGNGG